MPTVTVHEAKTTLSELLRRVEAGEEIVIARGDKPVAVLKPYAADDLARRRKAGMGCLTGKVPPTPDDVFFKPMTDDEMTEMFGEEFAALHRPAPLRAKGGKKKTCRFCSIRTHSSGSCRGMSGFRPAWRR